MKRTAITAAALLLLAAVAHAAPIKGTWSASLSEKEKGKIYFSLNRSTWSHNGQTMDVSALSGITAAQMTAAAQTPVTFAINREAGNIAFEGMFKQGDGVGHFNFTPNRQYVATLRSMGLNIDDLKGDKDEEDDLFQLALHDVSTEFIRSMQAIGYRETLEKYVAMRIFRVTPQLVEEFRQLGYDKLDADELISAQIHKATPKYIREMRAAGFSKLDFDDFISSRIHKVTPEFVEQIRAAGYLNLKYDDLMAFRIHKVTPEFIRELADLGYKNVDADDLVAMRIHRVTP